MISKTFKYTISVWKQKDIFRKLMYQHWKINHDDFRGQYPIVNETLPQNMQFNSQEIYLRVFFVNWRDCP